jgi:hypothetical protein
MSVPAASRSSASWKLCNHVFQLYWLRERALMAEIASAEVAGR